MPFNYIDLAVVLLLSYGLTRGAFRGLFIEVSSLLALVFGVFGSLHFSNLTSSLLSKYIDWEYLPLFAFTLTFIGIIIGVTWVGKLLTKLAKVVFLGVLNRVLGAIFGGLKWLVICGVIIWIFAQVDAFFNFLPKELTEKSLVFKPLKEFGSYLFELLNFKRGPTSSIETIIQRS